MKNPGPGTTVAYGLTATAGIAAVAHAVGAEALVVAGIVLGGLWIIGFRLWWTDPDRDKSWADIGRGVMMAVIMAFALGTLQDQIKDKISERSKQETFELSISQSKDLSGIDLSGKDLRGFYLAGKSFRDAVLRNANFAGANMQRSDLSGADMTGANLSGANLHDAKLRETILANATLRKTIFQTARMQQSRLPGADLEGAVMDGAKLADACLTGANMRGAFLQGANLTRAVLTGANLRGARLDYDLRPARLEQAGLKGAQRNPGERWPEGTSPGPPNEATMRKALAIEPKTRARTDRVVRVVDGDTFLAEGGPVRMIGIDAPAFGKSNFGKHSTAYLKTLLPEGSRFLYTEDAKKKDPFDRRLLYVWTADGRLVNAAMLQRGLAERSEDAANHAYINELRNAETYAKRVGLRIWFTCPAD